MAILFTRGTYSKIQTLQQQTMGYVALFSGRLDSPRHVCQKRLDLSIFEVQYRNDEIGVAYALRWVVLCPAAGDC